MALFLGPETGKGHKAAMRQTIQPPEQSSSKKHTRARVINGYYAGHCNTAKNFLVLRATQFATGTFGELGKNVEHDITRRHNLTANN